VGRQVLKHERTVPDEIVDKAGATYHRLYNKRLPASLKEVLPFTFEAFLNEVYDEETGLSYIILNYQGWNSWIVHEPAYNKIQMMLSEHAYALLMAHALKLKERMKR
jgi:hypothetical protein